MENGIRIRLENFISFLSSYSKKHNTYAPVQTDETLDYDYINDLNAGAVVLNVPKPVTPLKLFFLPVKENVTLDDPQEPGSLIVGVPSCDLNALDILDEIYLKEPFVDPVYQKRRANTILIGTDCYGHQEHCHCTTYGSNPYPERNFDISLSAFADHLYLIPASEKGSNLIDEMKGTVSDFEELTELPNGITSRRESAVTELQKLNSKLPDYERTGELIRNVNNGIWDKYSRGCVSCGGCATICPTCSCFLLIDKPGFEKVRQMDACQYPGFARVAGGEDPLHIRSDRFRNRYMCKYVWKPQKFEAVACTGCGRCIETCIAEINKNEMFAELAET